MFRFHHSVRTLNLAMNRSPTPFLRGSQLRFAATGSNAPLSHQPKKNKSAAAASPPVAPGAAASSNANANAIPPPAADAKPAEAKSSSDGGDSGSGSGNANGSGSGGSGLNVNGAVKTMLVLGAFAGALQYGYSNHYFDPIIKQITGRAPAPATPAPSSPSPNNKASSPFGAAAPAPAASTKPVATAPPAASKAPVPAAAPATAAAKSAPTPTPTPAPAPTPAPKSPAAPATPAAAAASGEEWTTDRLTVKLAELAAIEAADPRKLNATAAAAAAVKPAAAAPAAAAAAAAATAPAAASGKTEKGGAGPREWTPEEMTRKLKELKYAEEDRDSRQLERRVAEYQSAERDTRIREDVTAHERKLLESFARTQKDIETRREAALQAIAKDSKSDAKFDAERVRAVIKQFDAELSAAHRAAAANQIQAISTEGWQRAYKLLSDGDRAVSQALEQQYKINAELTEDELNRLRSEAKQQLETALKKEKDTNAATNGARAAAVHDLTLRVAAIDRILSSQAQYQTLSKQVYTLASTLTHVRALVEQSAPLTAEWQRLASDAKAFDDPFVSTAVRLVPPRVLASGVISLSTLQNSFVDVERNARRASYLPDPTRHDLLARAYARVMTALTFPERSSLVGGDDDQSRLTRAHYHVNRGELGKAVRELEQLKSAPVREAARRWREEAQHRLTVTLALDALHAHLDTLSQALTH